MLITMIIIIIMVILGMKVIIMMWCALVLFLLRGLLVARAVPSLQTPPCVRLWDVEDVSSQKSYTQLLRRFRVQG